MRARLLMLPLAGLLLVGCVYPRRSTPMRAWDGQRSPSGAPSGLWSVTILSARLPPHPRGGLSWDPNEGLPDVYVKIYRDEVLVWESERVDDSLEPSWEVSLPENLRVSASSHLRFEVWDQDEVGGDPVGVYHHVGLPPNALPGAEANLILDSDAVLTIRVDDPIANQGVGIDEYEVRADALVIHSVLENSPASRAGLEPGDHIEAFDGRPVSALSDNLAIGQLSMAFARHTELTLRRPGQSVRRVTLDRGAIWLEM